MITQALVVAEAGARFQLRSIRLNDDDSRSDEVLVEVRATGVCHADLTFRNERSMPGLFPAVMGHEGAGVVVRTGREVISVAKGDHVLLTYSCCGQCKHCQRKQTSYCKDAFGYSFGIGRLDGTKAFSSAEDGSQQPITSHFMGQSSFARHILVKETGVVKIDQDLPLRVLAPMGCGMQTGAGAMLNVLKPTSEEIVLVAGVGAVGLAALMSLKTLSHPPTKVVAVDVVPRRLEIARSMGATHVINSSELTDLKHALMDISDGHGIDKAIDTTGLPGVVSDLLSSAAKKGKVVSLGVNMLSSEVPVKLFETVNSGRAYLGCCMGDCFPQEFIPLLIQAWQRGAFPLHELIKTYPVQSAELAIQEILDGKTVKAVLTWD